MWWWVMSPYYDFCVFWCMAVNTVDKLHAVFIIYSIYSTLRSGDRRTAGGRGTRLEWAVVLALSECRNSRLIAQWNVTYGVEIPDGGNHGSLRICKGTFEWYTRKTPSRIASTVGSRLSYVGWLLIILAALKLIAKYRFSCGMAHHCCHSGWAA